MRSPNWIEESRLNTYPTSSSSSYSYLTALHWSLTQFTPASMEVRPYNILERIYSIFALLFALIAFSSFLGSITASITNLRKHTTESGKQQSLLRAFLRNNNVSSCLSSSIWHFLQVNHFAHRKRSHKVQVEILTLLPRHLMLRLHQELYGPFITRAPFFSRYTVVCNDAVLQLCSKIGERTLLCKQDLFLEGQEADKMFFTLSGCMRYEHQDPKMSVTIGMGAWITEAVLWVNWTHCAPMVAETTCEIIELYTEEFRLVVSNFPRFLSFAKMYAQLFITHLMDLSVDGNTDIMTD